MYNSFEKLILILFDKYDENDHLLLSVEELNYLNFIKNSLNNLSEDEIRDTLNTFSFNSNIEEKKVKVLMIMLIKLLVIEDFDYPYPVIVKNNKKFITESFKETIGQDILNKINEKLETISTILTNEQRKLLHEIQEGNYQILETYQNTLNFNIGLLTPINLAIQNNKLHEFIEAIKKNSNQNLGEIINYIPSSDSYQELYLSSIGFSVFTKKSTEVINILLDNGGDFRNVWNGSKFITEMNNDILSLTIIILYNKFQSLRNISTNKLIYTNTNQNYVKELITTYLPLYNQKSNLNLLGYKGIKGIKLFSKKKVTPHNVLQKLNKQSKKLMENYELLHQNLSNQIKYNNKLKIKRNTLSENQKKELLINYEKKKIMKNLDFLEEKGLYISKFNHNILNINKKIEEQKGRVKLKEGMRTRFKENNLERERLLSGGSISGIISTFISVLGISGFITLCGASTGGICFIVALVLVLIGFGGVSGSMYMNSFNKKAVKNKIIKNIDKYLNKIEGIDNLSILFNNIYDFSKLNNNSEKSNNNLKKDNNYSVLFEKKEQIFLRKIYHQIDSSYEYYKQIINYKNNNSKQINSSYDLFESTIYTPEDKNNYKLDKKISLGNNNSSSQIRDFINLKNQYLILKDNKSFSPHHYFLVSQDMYYSTRFLNYTKALFILMNDITNNSTYNSTYNSTNTDLEFIHFVEYLKKNIKNTNGSMKKEFKFYIDELNEKQRMNLNQIRKNENKRSNINLEIDPKYPDLSYAKIKSNYRLTGYLKRLKYVYDLHKNNKLDFIKFSFCILRSSLILSKNINDILKNLHCPKDYNLDKLEPFIIAPTSIDTGNKYKFYSSFEDAFENNIILMAKYDLTFKIIPKLKINTPKGNIKVQVTEYKNNVTTHTFEKNNYKPRISTKNIRMESERRPKKPIMNINNFIRKKKQSNSYKIWENEQKRLKREKEQREKEQKNMASENTQQHRGTYKTLKNAYSAITGKNRTNSTNSNKSSKAINQNNP